MLKNHVKRWMAGLMLAALAVTMVAPAAEAGHGTKKYRGRSSRVVQRTVYRPAYRPVQRIVHVHRSDDGAAFVGFVGGLVLGAVLSSAAQAHADEPRYDYYDPYCGEHFGTLEVYHSHFRTHYHPQVVRVIEVRNGDCVETLRYGGGEWRHWDSDWDD